MSTVGIDLDLNRLGRLAPLRKRSNLVPGLDLVDGCVVRRAIRLGATDNPDIRCRSVDALGVLGELELLDQPISQVGPPAGRDDDEIGRLGARRAPAGRREDVCPHVEHWKEIVATIPYPARRRSSAPW